jgi:prepilin-type N-terminal cleavage/methylation domain-containing protein
MKRDINSKFEIRNSQEIRSPKFEPRAFTLIEMLTVIAIIGILAALALTLLPQVSDKAKRSRVQAQLTQIETAIASYHAKHGFYPPDNPNNPNMNQLFYELTGVQWDNIAYTDAYGRKVATNQISQAFDVGGIVHSDSRVARNFLGDSNNVYTVQIGPVWVLGVPVDWPIVPGLTSPIPSQPTVNVWRYNSSNPTHNKNSYDLWAEIVLNMRKGTNGLPQVIRISNWERH